MEGSIEHYPSFGGSQVPPRNVDVWLPPGYRCGGAYPVVYLHDGQNLFDPDNAFIGVAWRVDRAMLNLMRTQGVGPAILVGIWNTPARLAEYMPQQPFDELPPSQQYEWANSHGTPSSDAYLAFIVDHLKPFVDRTYRTLRGRRHTHMMGSSMGGLVSLYGLCRYPEVFGGAACLSTHWPAGEGMMISYLARALPDPSTHRIYFDHGTETLDADYPPYQQRADEAMVAAGYVYGQNWLSRVFQGAEHSERAWCERVDIPLGFLLGA